MEIKVKHILVILIIVILAIVGITLVYKKSNNNGNKEILTETTEIEKQYTVFEDFNELGLHVAEKNGDWSNFHLSKKFRNKYNEKDGIFGDMQFDKVEYKPYHDGKYPFEEYSYLVITQGKKKTAYTFSMVNSLDGYDIEFYNIIKLTDEYGIDLDAKIILNNENYENSFRKLSRGGDDEKSVGVTPHFCKKYPYFLDLFIHYSPLTYNYIEFVSEKSSWDEKEAYFIVDSTLECKKRYYLVEFTIDDKGYLDDAVVHMVNEEEYEGNNNYSAQKLFYKNSNLDNTSVSEKLKSRLNGNSYFKEIDLIDVNDLGVEKSPYEESSHSNWNNIFIRGYTFLNGERQFYYTEYIEDKDRNIDDVICTKLPYTNMSIEEVKEAYLKDHPQE